MEDGWANGMKDDGSGEKRKRKGRGRIAKKES